jgi:hypothetical protein
MKARQSLLSAWLILATGLLAAHPAMATSPVWANNPTDLTTQAGQTFSQKLTDLLSSQGTGTILFTLVPSSGGQRAPSWLSISGNMLVAASPHPALQDAGSYSFGVAAGNGTDAAAIADFNLTVQAPPTCNVVQVNLGSEPENTPFPAYDLTKPPASCVDPAGGSLTFAWDSTSTPPAWLSLGGSVISGTAPWNAQHSNVGSFAPKLTVTGKFGSISLPVAGSVTRWFRPPVWNANPVILPNAPDNGVLYQQNLTSDVTIYEQVPVTYTLTQGVADNWIALDSASGILQGTPAPKDDGPVTLVAQISQTDPVNTATTVNASAQLKFSVTHVPLPPTCTTPVNFLALIGQPFSGSLAATDPQAERLTFKATAGPAWLITASSGTLSGSPTMADDGQTETATFTATNTDQLSCTIQASIQIVQLQWTQNPIQLPPGTALQTYPYPPTGAPVTLATYVKADSGDALTFGRAPGSTTAAWANLAPDGTVTGTPGTADVGPNSFKAQVTDSNGITLTVTVNIKVNPAIQPPQCNPITLPDAMAGSLYTQGLSKFCTDPMQGTLTYSRNSGPAWAGLSSSGQITGTPAIADIGTGNYSVHVANAFAGIDVSFTITVDAPQLGWTTDPINLGTQTVGQAWTFDLNPYIKNPSGLPYTCAKAPPQGTTPNGPNWLSVSTDCHASGTPGPTDVGQYTVIFQVTNGGTPVTVGAFGQVVNGAPPKLGPMVFTVYVGNTLSVNLNDPQYVTSNSPPLTFAPANVDTWVSLGGTGQLTATPQAAQLGDHTYTITVTDKYGQSSSGPLVIHVKNQPSPPVCNPDPILLTANVNQPFSASIASDVTDTSGTTVTFAKVWGVNPEWLNISASGQLNGTPIPANAGNNSYLVSATNGLGASANCTVIITVKSGSPIDDTVGVDDTVPWATAQAENLWIVDSAKTCGSASNLLTSFEQNVGVYFSALDTAQVQHTGVYVSSNPVRLGILNWKLTGTPVKGATGSILLTWTEGTGEAADFVQRIESLDACKGCNSPIWAQYLFYQQLPGLAEYEKTYFVPTVPMDTLILTDHTDSYASYEKGTSQAGKTPTQFANDFTGLHTAAQKPYRINVMASTCVSSSSDDDDSLTATADDSPYHDLTSATNGTYWTVDGQTLTMAAAMTQFANQVKFRALVLSKKEIPLSKVPADPTKIQVLVNGQQLTAEQWSYNAAKNAVDIYWAKIDISALQPGDKIEIKYQTAS